jgi:hypothetical protein
LGNEFEAIKLRALYVDIAYGFSVGQVNKKQAYIKHLSPLDQGTIDKQYLSFFEAGRAEGLKTEEEVLAHLKKTGQWNDKDQLEVAELRKYISFAESGLKKIWVGKIEAEQQLEEAKRKLFIKLEARNDLLRLTAEAYASKKVDELYIFNSLFSDKNLTQPLVDDTEYEYLETQEISKIISDYSLIMKDFSSSVFKKIALSGFFQNILSLCGDNLSEFFQLPIFKLTFYQSECLSYGRFFKHIISNSKYPPTPEMMDNPDLLIDSYEMSKALDAERQKHGDGPNVSIVGEDPNAPKMESLAESAAKSGKKSLNMKEIMAAQKNNLRLV